MARYLVVRIGSLIVSIIGATLVVFLIMHAIPGGPFDAEKSQLSADQAAFCPSMFVWGSALRR